MRKGIDREPLISVVVATYNGERFLPAQLNSIFSQSYRRIEVIASDDCSQDNTLAILGDYRRTTELTVLTHARNVGVTKNFEAAIAHASGDLIAFADQDDVWLPEKVSCCVSKLQEDDAGLVFSDAQPVDENLCPLGQTHWHEMDFTPKKQDSFAVGGAFEVLMKEGNIITGTTMMVQSKLVRNFCPMSAKWVHDGWIAILASFYGVRMAFVDAPLVLYRQHAAQQVGYGKNKITRGVWLAKEAEAWGDLAAFIKSRCCFRDSTLMEARFREIESRAQHLRARRDFPDSRFYRLGPMLRELLTGRYRRHSKGLKTAIKDLLVR